MIRLPILVLLASLSTLAAASPCGTIGRDSVCVTESEYGDTWPFTFPAGELSCYTQHIAGMKRAEVVITHRGKTYAINGTAMANKDYLNSAPITKPHPQFIGGWMTPPSDFIHRGLALCR